MPFCNIQIKPKSVKTTFSTSCNLITQYNPLLPYLKTIIRKHLPILYSNQQMLGNFPHNTISVTYKKNKNLREILSPSTLMLYKRMQQKMWHLQELLSSFPPLLALLPSESIKLREFWSVTVEMWFIWYPANVVVSNMLGLLLAVKNNLEFTKVI